MLSTHAQRNKFKIGLLIIALAPKAAIRYLAPIYGPTYVDDEGGSHTVGLGASVVSQFVVFLLALGVGWLTDLYGVGRVMILNNLLALAFGFPLFYLLGEKAENTLWVMMLLGVFSGILQVRKKPQQIRKIRKIRKISHDPPLTANRSSSEFHSRVSAHFVRSSLVVHVRSS
eukprot:9120451-Pyramimonas_sp.AAC.4